MIEYFLQPDGSVMGSYTIDCVPYYEGDDGIFTTTEPATWDDTKPTSVFYKTRKFELGNEEFSVGFDESIINGTMKSLSLIALEGSFKLEGEQGAITKYLEGDSVFFSADSSSEAGGRFKVTLGAGARVRATWTAFK